jgi:thiamine biosynthesis lipoprotein
MGTVVSIRLAHTEPDNPAAIDAVADAQAVFDALNERFSLYVESSELSRIARGDLKLADASVTMRDAYAGALDWRSRTNGDFTPHRPDGVIDLNGTIKAVGIESAAAALHDRGLDDFSINCGGDVLVSGRPESGAWITGIVDPTNRDTQLSAIRHTDEWSAVATSSIVERGQHIWSQPQSEAIYAQVTVVARDIVTADVLATAIMSGGARALENAVSNLEVGVLAVRHDGELVGNARFRELVAR